ncbi:signal recognition particle-docking protein FtsY [uncultured Algimonas sp.]|uniref:signal recognition particle-docking protein FtsY n=1 Tax=uncultured Algimonas sp. TaxID=1547920 RepID=UPI002602E3D9|nr:signal recognition particle-docking protein FtsY [uncultured Algimonas sp.]
MAEKKKRGFLSKLGFKSKDEKLAIEAAEKAAAEKLIDERMAARMAAINAAALASARAQDAGTAEVSDEERARIEAEEKRQAEIQAARDVERAKQLAEENARRADAHAAEKAAEEERRAEDARLAELQAAREAEDRARREAEAKLRAEAAARLEAERQAEIARAASEAEAAELKRKAEAEATERARLEAERVAEETRLAEDRRVADAAAAQARAEDVRHQALADRLAREADEAERRAARAADRKAREQAESDERVRLAEDRRAQRIKAGLPPEPEPEPDVTAEGGFFDRISKGLRRSTSRMSDQMAASFNQRTLDRDALEDLEDILIMADLGSDVAEKVSGRLAEDKFDKQVTDLEIKVALAETISDILTPLETPFVLGLARPQVILFAGVNGSGKTTTLGKIAKRFGDQGKRVLICAADTFRAAAVEQLTVWGERAGAPVMSGQPGADAASLVFDAMNRARDEDYDILMIDTAGRLQNRTELMDELAKIIRVIEKTDPSAPHHSVLVLDATVGQNALSQVEAFRETAKISGLIMTKLDGTAKGGVLVALSEKYRLPIHFIGIGEAIGDLETFSAPVFAAALSGVADNVSA